MREIKFRAQTVIDHSWIVGYYVKQNDGQHVIHESDGSCCMWGIDPKTLGEYTGISYKHQPIFEGDILKVHNIYPQTGEPKYFYEEVKWIANKAKFNLEDIFGYKVEVIEVIGNIYENPNLLENKND